MTFFEQFYSDVGSLQIIVADGNKNLRLKNFEKYCKEPKIRLYLRAPYTPGETAKLNMLQGSPDVCLAFMI